MFPPGDFERTREAAAAGSPDALGELWRAFNPVLVRYLLVFSRDHADDLASETWIAAARGLGNFAGAEEEFRRWLITIARNKALDFSRASTRRQAREMSDAIDSAHLTFSDADTLSRLESPTFELLVRELSPGDAELIYLRYGAELTSAEIALLVGKSPQAVRVALHRALGRLRQVVLAERGQLEV